MALMLILFSAKHAGPVAGTERCLGYQVISDLHHRKLVSNVDIKGCIP